VNEPRELAEEMYSEIRRIAQDFNLHTVPSITVMQWADRLKAMAPLNEVERWKAALAAHCIQCPQCHAAIIKEQCSSLPAEGIERRQQTDEAFRMTEVPDSRGSSVAAGPETLEREIQIAQAEVFAVGTGEHLERFIADRMRFAYQLGLGGTDAPPPAPPVCRRCGGSGWIAEKRSIGDGWGEVDSCPACEPAADAPPPAPPNVLRAIHGEHHAETFEGCGHWRCEQARNATAPTHAARSLAKSLPDELLETLRPVWGNTNVSVIRHWRDRVLGLP
jgi:hypothetical protein